MHAQDTYCPIRIQELVENVKTVASPETSNKEESEFSCSGDVDSLFVSSQSCESLYIPTPQKKLWEHRVSVEVPIPDSLCFLELKQLESFVQQLSFYWH